MACLDWSQCPAVESVPGKVSGAWVFKGTRMPVQTVFENLEAGATVDEITDWFRIPKEQLIEVLEFAARSVISFMCSSAIENPMTKRTEFSFSSSLEYMRSSS